MNKKEILNELLKNFPELGEDKKALNEALDFLIEKNPKVSIDKDFEKNLKKRLKTIIDLKSEKSKFKIWNILIPSLTILVFVFGLSYFYSDTKFLNNKNNTLYNNISNPDFKQDNLEDYGENSLKGGSYMMKMAPNPSVSGDRLDETLDYNDNIHIEDDIYVEEDKNVVDDTHIIDSLDNLNFTKKIETFEDYCKRFGGKFIEKESKKSCKLKEKYCLERDFINGKCNFKDMKIK